MGGCSATNANRRYGRSLDVLPGLLEDRDAHDAALTTAAALALIYGWRFFHPYIRTVLHLDDGPFSDVHDAIREKLHRLIES
jgi:hypothetical protein